MTVKVTISIDEQVKRSLSILARKNKKTVSGFISEMIKRESIRENVDTAGHGLGTRLRPDHPVLSEDTDEDYKKMLGRLREEKHLI